jgi:hypothetical protein|tara:strand:- start:13003 stop:13311 length:309 start_codon:yes stop_codon:yes gene_type:complete
MNYKHVIALIVTVLVTQKALAETKIEHQCTDALSDVTRSLMTSSTNAALSEVVRNSTKYTKVREYIWSVWIPKLKKDKNFTVNTFTMDAKKYIQECASFASK